MSSPTDVWVLKYAPQTIDSVILSEDNRKYFSALTDIKNNLLFLGKTGIGKSTLAKILARKFSPNSYIFINASEESGIDVVRNKISKFVETVSFDGNQKIVILDECDGLSPNAQQALRGIMEEYLADVKFILTGNYKNKLIEAIISRCESFEFAVDKKAVSKLIATILSKEGIDFSGPEVLDGLKELLRKHFPDIRKIINELQKCCATKKFVAPAKNQNGVAQTVFEKLQAKEDTFKIREFVIAHETDFNNDYHFLMRELFDFYVIKCNSSALLLVTEYMYRDATVMDKEVNFSALLFNLSKLK